MRYFAISENKMIAGPYWDVNRLIDDVKKLYADNLPATIIDENNQIHATINPLPQAKYNPGTSRSITVNEIQFFFHRPYLYRVNS